MRVRFGPRDATPKIKNTSNIKYLVSFQEGQQLRGSRERLISLKFLTCQGIRLRWNLISRIKILESLQQLHLHQQKTFLRLMWGIRARDSGR